MNNNELPSKCVALVAHKVSRGILGKGTESFTTVPGTCRHDAVEDGLCAMHAKVYARYAKINAARRAATAK